MTTRISKACHECRVRKIRCDGNQPCQHCESRSLQCAYRAKARNRIRKVSRPLGGTAGHGIEDEASELSVDSPGFAGDRSINIHSVAATHRASPSCLHQVYYGPSSMFSLMHSIYHQIEGTRPNSPSHHPVEEVGPGLDLFSHRRLFFGDIVNAQPSNVISDDNSALMLDTVTASRFLERYFATFWCGLPTMSKDYYRQRMSDIFEPPAVLRFDSPDSIILALALAIGANLLGEEAASMLLFQKAKHGAARLDEAVNLQMTQVYLMMALLQLERARPNSAFLHVGTAVRRAVAAGLHKEAGSRDGGWEEETEQRRITFWSIYFWETWICFSLGRPSSVPDPGDSVPIPKNQPLLRSMVKLSRIMSKCYERIYNPKDSSLLRIWNAANEIRADLRHFAEQEPLNINAELLHGEAGISQAILSTMYYHTFQLTFRPFLILRSKLRQKSLEGHPVTALPWLNKACGYCIEAAKNMITYLLGACRHNILCREIKYHNFFIEGACYTLAFDMLQEPSDVHRNLPWIRSSIRCLQSMLPKKGSDSAQTPITIAALERMVRFVIPDFTVDTSPEPGAQLPLPPHTSGENPKVMAFVDRTTDFSGSDYSSTPYGPAGNHHTPGNMGQEMNDFTAADIGLDFDFGSMDMDAFLSVDPNLDWSFRP